MRPSAPGIPTIFVLVWTMGCPPPLTPPTNGEEPDYDGGIEMPNCAVPQPSVTVIATSFENSCGIADGAMYCWGNPDYGIVVASGSERTGEPIQIGADTDWIAVTLGTTYACGIRSETGGQKAYCWGLGVDEGGGIVTTPTQEQSQRNDWVDVSAGDTFTCARTSGNALYCWGEGTYLGNGAEQDSTWVPVQVSGTFTGIELGAEHACAMGSDSLVYCWGSNESARTGVQITTGITSSPSAISSNAMSWASVSAGDRHTCALANGDVFCWGGNANDQLGYETTGAYSTTVESPNGANGYTWIASGTSHTCGVRNTELLCWGNGNEGALGTGDTQDRPVPQVVGSDGNWTLVAAGAKHTCGVRDDQLYCWGTDQRGSLGIDAMHDTIYSSPQPVCFPE